jgi:hypothetical protein
VLTATSQVLGAPSVLGHLPFYSVVSIRSLGAGAGPAAGIEGGLASLDALLLGGLAVGALVAFAVGIVRVATLAASHAAFRRRIAQRVAVDDDRLTSWARELTPVDLVLTRSPALRAPVAFSREVCLPDRAFAELSREELHAVIAHEVAHVRRRDDRWLWLALLAERFLVIQPLNAWTLRELRALGECACDDWARGVTGDARPLVTALAKVAGWLQAEAPAAGGVAALSRPGAGGEGLVVRRLRRLVTGDARLGSRPRADLEATARARIAAAVLLLVAGGVLPSADVTGRPLRRGGADGPASAPVVTIRAVDPAGQFTITLVRGRAVAATVDGVPVSARRIRQSGQRVSIADAGGGGALDVAVSPDGGGIRWAPRRPAGGSIP